MKLEKAVISVDISVSEWEKKLVKFLASGLTVPEIEKTINKNGRSIEYELSKLKTRLQCKTSAQLVSFFLRNKLID